jgi:hypothetical protein
MVPERPVQRAFSGILVLSYTPGRRTAFSGRRRRKGERMRRKTFVIVLIVFAVLVVAAMALRGDGHAMLSDMFRSMHGR